ncbi:hypothetical protein A2303_00380 [Candidatus Falkowbacteria bacterium RIFOXYB2_FULL_47_14]|uniref:O-antigen ligase-related domain-containing protein n=1 Tax=Candidatus Falkowbacteria bacterium RIFOXYA2_FULL_47_19 TaxID=1797994 RepID=A0A1F5SN75_9BACT|nr:MAG: hypothetical protein A2227_03785 [Candidatus Falkowbacteria bacterium RIFOXYA2_FULL_47_19]OGF37331.1 MAG: hypothetical protein A2468_02145 [Candidatus Falkowbacteria bacterium RIFOXYC2_FULL_46_15]OGF42833.1 MAG: hypothetical protein A2303_00380 [Candidatus Falkowbacteria bacterium RIFOXYB2_FULL_47_14]
MSTTYKKIIEYGLYFLVFLLPWQTRWIIRPGIINGGYSEFGTISLYGTDVVLAFLLFAAAAFFLLKRFQYPISNAQYPINDQLSIFKHKFFLFSIALFDLIIFISIFRSPDKLVALQKYFWFLLGVGLFWMVVSADYDRIKMLYAFLTGAVVQAILGIWQFLSQSSFACKWLGLASHDPAVPGTSVIETLSGERWLRAYGGLDHPNILGGYLVVGLLFLFMLLFKSSEANRPILDIRYRILGGNKNFLSDSGLRKYPIFNIQYLIFLYPYLLWSLFLVFLSAIFFTFSRAAWAGLIFGILAMFSSALIKKDLSTQKYLLKIVLAGGIMIFIFFNLFSDLVLTRLSRDTRLEIKSNTERIESLKSAREIISDNWLFGVGVGNYTQYLHKIEPNLKAWDYQPVHNVFLLIWSEIGIIGSVLFLSVFCAIVYILWKRDGTTKDEIYIIALLASMFVLFQADHWWWSGHFGMLFLGLIMGLVFDKLPAGKL